MPPGAAGGVGASTVTMACADCVLSAMLVAVTVTFVVEATVGAVKKPVGEIVPLEADQVTVVFEVFFTVAENCWLVPVAISADVGVIETDTARGGLTETEACALCDGSATLVAVTVTTLVAVTAGAVNMPVDEIVPFEADQVTELFEVLLTVAENCWVAPEEMLADFGAMETETATCVAGSTETEA